MPRGIINTVCPRDCYDTCFLRVKVDDGKIVSVKGDPVNPVTRGFTCPRGAKDGERVDRNRVLFPYRRKNQSIHKITWDQALQEISEKLRTALENYGSEAVLHLEYAGNTGLLTWYYPQRIWNALGATKTDNALCSTSGHEAISLHYGESYGIQPEELLEQKFIVFWGFNAAVSSIHMWRLAREARKNGALIAVVDPRKSKSAKKTDIWLNPYPGTDIALVYGVMRCLIGHEYIDQDFIKNWTVGYEELKKEVMKWTPKRVEEVTGLKWSTIENFSRHYGELRPSATMIGIGFQKSNQGANSVRAVALLPALLGLHRGFFYSNGNAYFVDFSYLTGERLTSKKPKTVSQVDLSRLVEQGDFKFIYIYNMNPALTLPDQTAFRKGLSSKDVFIVVHETHWTESTDYADIILPAATYLEKEDIVIPWSHRYVRMSKKAVDPLGKSKDEVWVTKELVERLNLNEEWLHEDQWEAVEKSLENSLYKGTYKDLMKGKSVELKYRSLDKYQTSTGKIELYSRKAVKLGFTSLPFHDSQLLGEGEFILLNSCLSHYTHTQFQEIYGPIPAIVRINPDDSELLGIKEGEIISLYNSHGNINVKAEISNTVPLGVLWSPKLLVGLDKISQNILTTGNPQLIGKGPKFNSTVVKILK